MRTFVSYLYTLRVLRAPTNTTPFDRNGSTENSNSKQGMEGGGIRTGQDHVLRLTFS